MSLSQLKQVEVQEFLSLDKLVVGQLKWKPLRGKSVTRYRMEFFGQSANKKFHFRVVASKCFRNFSVCMLIGNQAVTMYTEHFEHKNPDGTKVREPHKHRYTDEHGMRETYIPSDVDKHANYSIKLLQCLKEWNVASQFSRAPLLPSEEHLDVDH
jgi:hypothetical protein